MAMDFIQFTNVFPTDPANSYTLYLRKDTVLSFEIVSDDRDSGKWSVVANCIGGTNFTVTSNLDYPSALTFMTNLFSYNWDAITPTKVKALYFKT